jgi:hypothetical protein
MSYSKIAQEPALDLEMTGAAAAVLASGDDDAFDDFAEPYGPVAHDEASWFASSRDEREAEEFVARLLGR